LTVVYRIGYCPTPVPRMPALLASLGYGSTLGNGRWHTQGPLQVVYCGSSRALCQLEKRVHANGANLKDQALMQLLLPDGAPVQDVRALGLPADWRANDAVTQQMGDAWIASGAALGLWVPSYVEPGEDNLLLNPAHPAYAAITLTIERYPLVFDPRMF
jgi:RES domain-containing protein